MLIVGVDRNRKHAPRSPLEGVLLAVSLPDTGRAVAFGDIDHLFIYVLLRLGLAARRNFANVSVIGAPGAVENNERTGNAFQVPVFEFDFVDILDEKAAHDWNFLLGLPVLVGIDSFPLGILCPAINFHSTSS